MLPINLANQRPLWHALPMTINDHVDRMLGPKIAVWTSLLCTCLVLDSSLWLHTAGPKIENWQWRFSNEFGRMIASGRSRQIPRTQMDAGRVQKNNETTMKNMSRTCPELRKFYVPSLTEFSKYVPLGISFGVPSFWTCSTRGEHGSRERRTSVGNRNLPTKGGNLWGESSPKWRETKGTIVRQQRWQFFLTFETVSVSHYHTMFIFRTGSCYILVHCPCIMG